LDAQVLGISVDSVPCLKAWAESLEGINYPLLSDFWPHGGVAQKYGVLRSDGRTERALFVIDKRGVIRYVDVHDIDKQPDNEELYTVIRRIDPDAAAKEQLLTQAEGKSVELPKGGIVLYCTSWCPACRRARTWLTDRGLKYVEVNIDETPLAALQIKQWTGGNRTTPTFDIEGDVIINFDEQKVTEALKKHKLL
jgi:glutaredoxin